MRLAVTVVPAWTVTTTGLQVPVGFAGSGPQSVPTVTGPSRIQVLSDVHVWSAEITPLTTTKVGSSSAIVNVSAALFALPAVFAAVTTAV